MPVRFGAVVVGSFAHSAAKSRRLLVQADNASGENKNKWIFGIMGLFLLLGLFDEVEVNMLLRGHTHDLQDAVFGNFHNALYFEG